MIWSVKKKRLEQERKGNGLIIFVKNPVKGTVKTRIAKDSDEGYALKVYLELQRHTRIISENTNAIRYLYYSSHLPEEDLWDANIFNKKLQKGDDLGEKMKNAIREVINCHEKVIIIGSDCIQLKESLIENAFSKLDNFDIVLGPALDGGYYLIGVKHPFDYIFDGIPWSTSEVLDKTLQKILSSGLSCHLLQELSDIDYMEDWEKYGYPVV